MFSLFNWFFPSSSTVPASPARPVTKKTHILSDSEYMTILDRLDRLENQVAKSPMAHSPVAKDVLPQQHSHFEQIRSELMEKIKQLRLRESLGFGPDETKLLNDLEKSVML